MTTLFARLLLGDLFVHGIGGAKYDQVTDLLIARFFGLEPPGYLTVTATLRLPIAHEEPTLDDRRLIDSRLRELAYHPERHANRDCTVPAARIAMESKTALGGHSANHRKWSPPLPIHPPGERGAATLRRTAAKRARLPSANGWLRRCGPRRSYRRESMRSASIRLPRCEN